MVRDQVFARLREEALFSRTCSVFQLFLAGREAEVRRRTADIMDIAFELGYEDYINLTKSFKRIYQMTPTQYRNYYKYGKTTTIINPNNQ